MTPDGHTITETFLEVGDGHTLYVHDWGNRRAKTPIVFLHGGPGSGCGDGHKQLFDPEQQRVIFFDQRGAGRSLPFGSLEHNKTDDLIEDVEKIAKYFKFQNFILVGGSWGSCLALAYALKYPKRVAAMVLRGIFTGSQAEIDWIDKGYWRNFFPDLWDKLLAATPKSHHNDPIAYHARRMFSSDEQAARKSAYTIGNIEAALLKLDDRFMSRPFDEFDPAATRIATHYLVNRCFIPDRHILANAHKLTVPIWIVQGRYDFVCPPAAAYELHQKLPNNHLIWTIVGHLGSDRANYDVTRAILQTLTQSTPKTRSVRARIA